MNEILVATVAGYNSKGELLFGLRQDCNLWSLPGGHMEAGEEPTHAVVRELFEETGMVAKKLEYLGHGIVRPKDGNVRVFVFKARLDDDREPHGDNDPDEEFKTFRWVNVKEGLPKDIANHLYNGNDVALRLLGLQEGPLRKYELGFPVSAEVQPLRKSDAPEFGPQIQRLYKMAEGGEVGNLLLSMKAPWFTSRHLQALATDRAFHNLPDDPVLLKRLVSHSQATPEILHRAMETRSDTKGGSAADLGEMIWKERGNEYLRQNPALQAQLIDDLTNHKPVGSTESQPYIHNLVEGMDETQLDNFLSSNNVRYSYVKSDNEDPDGGPSSIFGPAINERLGHPMPQAILHKIVANRNGYPYKIYKRALGHPDTDPELRTNLLNRALIASNGAPDSYLFNEANQYAPKALAQHLSTNLSLAEQPNLPYYDPHRDPKKPLRVGETTVPAAPEVAKELKRLVMSKNSDPADAAQVANYAQFTPEDTEQAVAVNPEDRAVYFIGNSGWTPELGDKLMANASPLLQHTLVVQPQGATQAIKQKVFAAADPNTQAEIVRKNQDDELWPTVVQHMTTNPELARTVADRFGTTSVPAPPSLLESMHAHTDPTLRAWAVNAARQVGYPKAKEWDRELLHNPRGEHTGFGVLEGETSHPTGFDDPASQDLAFNHADPQVRRNYLQSEHLQPHHVQALFDEARRDPQGPAAKDFLSVARSSAFRAMPVAMQEQAVNHLSQEIGKGASSDPYLTMERLIARNPHPEILRSAYKQMEARFTPQVAARQFSSHLLGNPNTPKDVLERLIHATGGDRPTTLEALGMHPNADENTLKLAASKVEFPTQEFRLAQAAIDPDAHHQARVQVRPGMAKLRKIRDIILEKEPQRQEISPKHLPPGDWSMGRTPGGNISAKLLQAHIDAQAPRVFNVDAQGTWGGYQRHSDEPSKIFRLQITNAQRQELKAKGLLRAFEKMSRFSKENGHPSTGTGTVGWVRFTGDKDRGYFIEETQHDLNPETHMKIRESLEKRKAKVPDYILTPEEVHAAKAVHSVLFGDTVPQELLHEGFLQHLRDQGHHDVPVTIHSTESKHRQLAHIGHLEVGDPAPAHMRDSYDKVPRKLGYEPDSYSSLPKVHTGSTGGEDDNLKPGEPIWKNKVRKSEDE